MSKRTKRKHKYPLYEIRWLDAEGEAGWSDPKAPLEPVPCVNVGFLINENEEYVKLAAAYIDKPSDDQVSSTDIIPRRMIQSMRELLTRYKPDGKEKTETSTS